jgi:hypothetical protein
MLKIITQVPGSIGPSENAEHRINILRKTKEHILVFAAMSLALESHKASLVQMHNSLVESSASFGFSFKTLVPLFTDVAGLFRT